METDELCHFFLPDEMIMIIAEYLDSFSVISSLVRVCKQFKRVSLQNFKHLQISSFHHVNFQYFDQCSYFKTLKSLDLENCSTINLEIFKKLIKNGNLQELKMISLPHCQESFDLVIEIGNLYNENFKNYQKNIQFNYSLSKLSNIHVKNLCQLKLITPQDYFNKITQYQHANTFLDVVQSRKGELFGKSKQLEKLLIHLLGRFIAPELTTIFPNIHYPRTFLLHGPSNSGKSMICDALHESISSNAIEFNKFLNSKMNNHHEIMVALRMVFKISRRFSKYVFSFLIFKSDSFLSDDNCHVISQYLTLLDYSEHYSELLSIIQCCRSYSKVDCSVRKRFEVTLEIQYLTGNDLAMFVKYQLERRFVSGVSMDMVWNIVKLCEGKSYSPLEIENMIGESIESGNSFIMERFSALIESTKLIFYSK